MWDLIVSVPDHCLSFYFSCGNRAIYELRNNFDSVYYHELATSCKSGLASFL